jgi:hypothetical protein
MAIIMKLEAFVENGKNVELYASQPFGVLTSQGDPDVFFTIATVEEVCAAEEEEKIPGEIQDILGRNVIDPDGIEIPRNFHGN